MGSREIDRLEVKILRAEGLPYVQGSDPNSYVEVKCGLMQFRTKTIPNETEPEWNAQLMIFSPIKLNDVAQILIEVKHEGVGDNGHVSLGLIPFDLSHVFSAPTIPYLETMPLERSLGMLESPMGSITFQITYFEHAKEEEEKEEGGSGQGVSMDMSDVGFHQTLDESQLRPPNVLKVEVMSAKNLYKKDRNRRFNTKVVIKCNHYTETTAFVKSNGNPVWNSLFMLPVQDGHQFLEAELIESGVISNRLLGRCKVSIIDIARSGLEGLDEWIPLYGENMQFGGEEEEEEEERGRGVLRLKVQWLYDAEFKPSKLKEAMQRLEEKRSKERKRKKETELLALTEEEGEEKGEAYYDNEDDDDDLKELEEGKGKSFFLSREELLQEEQKRQDRKDEVARFQSELLENGSSLSSLKSGEYNVKVHIIECKDIKGEDLEGTSDPFVIVNCGGSVKKTRVVKKVTSCVFDETFYFTFPYLSKQEAEDTKIELSLFDMDMFSPSDLIGAVHFDLGDIYEREHHELYRTWVAVIDTEEKESNGAQGWMKISIVVLGPGDSEQPHDLDKEILDEIAEEQQSGVMGGGSVMVSQDIQQKLHFVVLSLVELAELSLPTPSSLFSSSSSSSSSSCDLYVQVDFSTNPSLKSEVISFSTRERIYHTFHDEFWVPVWKPSFVTRMTLSFWEKRSIFKKDILIASAHFDISSFPETTREASLLEDETSLFSSTKNTWKGPKPKWVHLYGAPLSSQNGSKQHSVDARMNKFPDLGSCYRGRALLALKVITDPDASLDDDGVIRPLPIRDLGISPSSYVPPVTAYSMKCSFLVGSELPFQGPGFAIVQWGEHFLTSGVNMVSREGSVYWGSTVDLREMMMVEDVGNLPDVFIYLVKGQEGQKTKLVSYFRLKAITLLSQSWSSPPKWYHLWKEPCSSSSTSASSSFLEDEYPGSVLLRLSLAHKDDAFDEDGIIGSNGIVGWEEDPVITEQKEPYGLRIHIYQAKDLPCLHESTILTPYVKVRFGGVKKKTNERERTTNPQFYESLEFHDMLPTNHCYGPEVVIQVWDKQTVGMNTPVGILRLPLTEARVCTSRSIPKPHYPTWYKLSNVNGTQGQGEILCSLQLIRKRSLDEKLERLPELAPDLRTCYMEVLVMGLRDLTPVSMRGIKKPFLKFQIEAAGLKETIKTSSSDKPNPTNPNFLEKHILKLKLPENPVFAPRLDLFLYDAKIADQFIGYTSIDLEKKLPWSVLYESPQTETISFLESLKQRRKRLEREKEEKGDGGMSSLLAMDEEEGKEVFDYEDYYSMKKDKDMDEFEDDEEDEVSRQRRLERKAALESFQEDHGIFHEEKDKDENDTGAGVFKYHLSSATSSKEMQNRFNEMIPIAQEDEHEVRLEHEMTGLSSSKSSSKAEGDFNWFTDDFEKEGAAELALYYDNEKDEEIPLHALDLDFPSAWTSDEFLKGREWWIQGQTEEMEMNGILPEEEEEEEKGGSRGPGHSSTNLSKRKKKKKRELGAEEQSDFVESKELEQYLQTSPFEKYPLFRGVDKERFHYQQGSLHTVYETYQPQMENKGKKKEMGFLKAIVRITDADPRSDPLPISFNDIKKHDKANYFARLYILKAANLKPPLSIQNKRRKKQYLPNPYLQLTIGDGKKYSKQQMMILDSDDEDSDGSEDEGESSSLLKKNKKKKKKKGRNKSSGNMIFSDKKVIVDRKHMKKKTLNPKFYSVFEFPLEIPGNDTNLTISVYTKDGWLFKDELIGSTFIDLEDRIFHDKWQNIGTTFELSENDEFSKRYEEVGPLKPLEIRNLYAHTESEHPNRLAKLSNRLQGQLYCFLDIFHERDATYYAREPLFIPPKDLEFEVRVVVWKSKNVPAQDMGNMSDLFVKCWLEGGDKEKQETDTHWRCKNGSGSWNYRMKFPLKLPLSSPEMGRLHVQIWDKDVFKYNDVIGENSVDLYQFLLKAYVHNREVIPFKEINRARSDFKRSQRRLAAKKRDEARSQGSHSIHQQPLSSKHGSQGHWNKNDIEVGFGNLEAMEREDLESMQKGDNDETTLYFSNSIYQGDSSDEVPLLSKEEGDEEDENAHGLTKQEEEDEEDDDAKDMVNNFKSLIGIGDAIPSDATWIRLSHHDYDRGVVEETGEIAISVYILPKKDADDRPAGKGRNEPNNDPYLPPPMGRMQLSMNPFKLLMELCGPELLFKIICVCACMFCLTALAFLGIYLNSFMSVAAIF